MKTRFTSVKMLFLSLALSSTYNLFASNVDESIVKTVAVNYMKNKTGKDATISEIITEEYKGKTSVYGINFEGGGWIIVSSRDELWPILGYNTTGKYESRKNSINPTFNAIIDIYGQTVYAIDSIADTPSSSNFLGSSNSLAYSSSHAELSKQEERDQIKNKWNSLISGVSLRSYTPGKNLLKDERDYNYWSQQMTNDGLELYNNDCPYDSISDCRAIVGCPALSLSQVMWKWRWPEFAEISQGAYLSSENHIVVDFTKREKLTRGVVSYDGFDWNLIPNILNANSTSDQVKETGHLLRQVGESLHIYYGCGNEGDLGSGILNCEIFDLYRHALGELGYNNYSFVVVNHSGQMIDNWYNHSWNQLIKTEIDAERPVIYQCWGYDPERNSNCGHLYVISGYDADDDNLFYCNLGWGGYYDGRYRIVRDDNYFGVLRGEEQGAIVGISPKYPTESGDIYLNFDGVYDKQTRGKNAMENIVAPSPEKSTFTIEKGGNLLLRAGKSIKLNPGFVVKNGGRFGAKIIPEFAEDHMIDVKLKENISGLTGILSFDVKNANSWYLTIRTADSTAFEHSSNVIESDGEVVVWSGNRYVTNDCTFEVTFMNNFGQETTYVGKFEERELVYLEEPSPSNWFERYRSNEKKDWMVYSNSNYSSSSNSNNGGAFSDLDEMESSINGIQIYPNPTTGRLYIRVVEESIITEVMVLNITGNVLLSKNESSNVFEIDLASLTKGVYFVNVVTNEESYMKKIVLK